MQGETKSRTVKVLDFEVPENRLKESLLEVLGRRGLRAELVIEDHRGIEKLDPGYADYANIYKYAFF